MKPDEFNTYAEQVMARSAEVTGLVSLEFLKTKRAA